MPHDPKTSPPRITHFEWGRIDVDGHGAFKDAQLWPGGARAWDWRETGTRHVPGIQVDDVRALIEVGAKEIILSRGVDLVLQTMPETFAWLEAQGVTVHHLQSEAAVRRYNALVGEGASVAMLLHSTC